VIIVFTSSRYIAVYYQQAKKMFVVVTALLFAGLIFSAVAFGQDKIKTPKQNELVYTLEPTTDAENIKFRVNLYFKGNETGTSKLKLPLEWDGQEKLYNQIKNLRAASANARIADTAEPHVKSIAYSPNETVRIQYEVVQDWSGGEIKNRLFNRAVLQKNYFYFIGNAFWIYPDWERTKRLSVELHWKNIPQNWTLANSFGTGKTKQRTEVSLYDFLKGVYLGGDFRIKTLAIRGKPVYVAARGSWQFADEQFNSTLKTIIELQREFWNDDLSYFLVVLLPTDSLKGTINGEARTNAFTLYIAKETALGFGIKYMIAHELFHAWNPMKLGTMENESLRWFVEGFTDYYTYLILLRGRLLPLDEYVTRHNALLKTYYLSPKRHLGIKQIMIDLRSDSNAERQLYLRGYLLAHNWNALIRLATNGKHSLDDAMRDLLKAGRKKGAVLSADTIGSTVRRYLKEGIEKDVQKYIENGLTIEPRNDILGSCLEMHWLEADGNKTALPQFKFKTEEVQKNNRECQGWFDTLPQS
jgi:predicted metalloprotease with PDZ domain